MQRLEYPAAIVRRLNAAETADELEAIARDNLPASTKAEVARAAEAIGSAAKVREKCLPDLVRRLNERSKS